MSSKLCKGGTPEAGEIHWHVLGAPRSIEPAEVVAEEAPTPGGTPEGGTEGQGHSQAHVEAAELRSQLLACQEEIQSRSQAAHQKGLQQGEANVRQQLGAQHDATLQRMARTIEEISGLRQRCRYAAENDVVKLSLAIARRIVHRELTMDPSTILGLVKAALGSMNMRELHRIRIHPSQAESLRRQLEAMGLPQRCEVVADAALERGGAILEGAHGNLDASVETQFEEIERGFADLVRHTQ
jgi:flagellar assembly protein FliH